MRTDDFDFHLPDKLIAQFPAMPRDSSRLLEVKPGHLHDRKCRDLPALLKRGDLLVLNNTKVIPTRLHGLRGAVRIEVTLHTKLSGDRWLAFARPGRRLKIGDNIQFGDQFSADVLEKCKGGEILLQIITSLSNSMQAIYDQGEVPLPPYIRRRDGQLKSDSASYQTIYAKEEGAVAAPTAGFHFTEDLFNALAKAGINRTFLTLHVGAGTFLPIKSENVEDHRMQGETGILNQDTAELINSTRNAGGRVIAVGSTSLRLLESAAAPDGTVSCFDDQTDLFISPGYRFKVVDLFFTNFHLPRSTLFLLVSAFSGTERIKSAYTHAIENEYRFFSYGDCCLLHPNDAT
tara:strand:- start:5444 stop:6484 length:1041 start_codon:yes stop_codon:yes gene_type:complete